MFLRGRDSVVFTLTYDSESKEIVVDVLEGEDGNEA